MGEAKHTKKRKGAQNSPGLGFFLPLHDHKTRREPGAGHRRWEKAGSAQPLHDGGSGAGCGAAPPHPEQVLVLGRPQRGATPPGWVQGSPLPRGWLPATHPAQGSSPGWVQRARAQGSPARGWVLSPLSPCSAAQLPGTGAEPPAGQDRAPPGWVQRGSVPGNPLRGQAQGRPRCRAAPRAGAGAGPPRAGAQGAGAQGAGAGAGAGPPAPWPALAAAAGGGTGGAQ